MTKNSSGGPRPVGLGSAGAAPSPAALTVNPGIIHDPNDPIATHHSYGMGGMGLGKSNTGAPFIPGGPGQQFHDPGMETSPLESPAPTGHPLDPIGLGGIGKVAAPTSTGPTSLDWGGDLSGDTQSRVNDIYAGPRAINPPPAPAQDLAGLAALKRAQARDSLGIGDMNGVGGHGKSRVFESRLGI